MVLRPELYDRLESLFHHVQIANEGEKMVSYYTQDALTGKTIQNISSSGEYYRVNCPYCFDLRKRLYVNHMWGYPDPETGSLNLHLCHCFNEDCLRMQERRRWLYADVFADVGDGSKDVVLHSNRITTEGPPLKFYWPGEVVPLDQLQSYHPACQYLPRSWL